MYTFKSLTGHAAAGRAAMTALAGAALVAGLAACEVGLFSAGTLGSGAGGSGALVVVPKRMTYFPADAFLPQGDTEVYLNLSSGGLSRPVPVEQARFSVAENDMNPVFRELEDSPGGRYFVFSQLGEARIRVEYDGRESLYTVRVLDTSGGGNGGSSGSGSGNTGTGSGGGIVIIGP
jgi:hypothetical protein